MGKGCRCARVRRSALSWRDRAEIGNDRRRLPGRAAFELGTKVEGPGRDQVGADVAVPTGSWGWSVSHSPAAGHGVALRATAG
jgi:hypothetical protein